MEQSSNSLNPAKGRDFQRKAAKILSLCVGVDFQIEYSVDIGNPPKAHKFDLASQDMRYIGESKNISWTESGNVPSAKMAFMNEAVFYLQHLSHDKHRFVVVRKDTCAMRTETLAEYYFRTYRHLLNGVFILEIDPESESVRRMGATTWP